MTFGGVCLSACRRCPLYVLILLLHPHLSCDFLTRIVSFLCCNCRTSLHICGPYRPPDL